VDSCEDCPDGELCRTYSDTGEGIFPKSNPFNYKTFPGTNFLPSVFTNNFDSGGVEMPNTLPSTPTIPYNLHETDPFVTEINPTSPEDDLSSVINGVLQDIEDMENLLEDQERTAASIASEMDFLQQSVLQRLDFGIDVLEGNPVENRAYSGFPLLHYNGPEKSKKVEPIYDAEGTLIGGNVNIHQIWYGQRIEADAGTIDPSAVLEVPWTVTYTVDVLNRGHDDFSPFAIFTDTPWYDTTTGKPCTYDPGPKRDENCARLPAYFDNETGKPCPYPDGPERDAKCKKKSTPPPNVGMDQSFFNMEDGTRTVFTIGMPPGDYLNLVYTWGWRNHPPRIQVMEKATKKIPNPYPPGSDGLCPTAYQGCALPQLEQAVFCNPDDPNTPRLAPGDPLPGGGTNTCSVASLPDCTSTRCTGDEDDPAQCRKNQLYAISKIGDLAPAKRLWNIFREQARETARAGRQAWVQWPGRQDLEQCRQDEEADCDPIIQELLNDPAIWNPWHEVAAAMEQQALPALFAFNDRTELPCYRRDPTKPRPFNCLDGLSPPEDSDIAVLFVNNTTYGELTEGGWVRWPDWETRFSKKDPGALLKVAAFNGDHFPHSYVIADFGGNRGWENQFKSSVKVAGSGCWFTFGRAYWWLNTGGPNGYVCVPPAGPDQPGDPFGQLGERRFDVQFNFEPSRRLRFYQFDPFHHDVAIYSVH